MNKIAKATMLVAAGALLMAQGANAAYVANDLVLGFNKGAGTGPNDYIVDLGQATTVVGVGGTVVKDLTSSFNVSTFNSLYSSLGSGVSLSVVGGNPISGANRDLYGTVLRTSNFGSASVAGSGTPTASNSSGVGAGANDVKSMINGLGLSAGGSTTVAQSDANSFYTWVLNPQSPSYSADSGLNPSGATAGSAIYEDLYKANSTGAFSYVGYFTLDLSGSPSLTFTPAGLVAVPEPATYGMMAGAGLLLVSLRRKLKKA